MCLTTITKRFASPLEREIIAYKVFRRADRGRGKNLYPLYYTVNGQDTWLHQIDIDDSEVYPRGVWLKAAAAPVAYGFVKYISGFHAFASEQGVERWLGLKKDKLRQRMYQVVKVKLRGVRIKGTQDSRYVIYVANEIFIPKR